MLAEQRRQATVAVAEGQRGGRHIACVERACLGLPEGEQVFQIEDQAQYGDCSAGVLASTALRTGRMQVDAMWVIGLMRPRFLSGRDGRSHVGAGHTCASHGREEGDHAVFCRWS